MMNRAGFPLRNVRIQESDHQNYFANRARGLVDSTWSIFDHVWLFVVSVAYDIMPKAKPSWIHRGYLFLYAKSQPAIASKTLRTLASRTVTQIGRALRFEG